MNSEGDCFSESLRLDVGRGEYVPDVSLRRKEVIELSAMFGVEYVICI